MLKRWKLIAGWALAGALLFGLNALPTKAGADAPVTYPSTQIVLPSIHGVVTCDTTTLTWTVTYTVVGHAGSVLFVYPDGGAPNAGTVNGLPTDIPANGVATFTVTGIPKATGFYQIDVVSFGIDGSHDLLSTGPITGTCDPVAPVTTPAPVVPPVTPAPTPPAAAPVAPAPAVAPPAAVQKPLAFTGAPIGAEIGVALVLILWGTVLVRKARRMA